MLDTSREVEQAISALTAELLKLSPLEGEARTALSVTIENAISRLTLAILSQNQNAASPPSEPCPDRMRPALATAGAA